MNPIIEIEHLTKYYGKREIIRDYSDFFNSGTFIGTAVETAVADDMAHEFVHDLSVGMIASEIVSDFNTTYIGAAENTGTIYASKSH